MSHDAPATPSDESSGTVAFRRRLYTRVLLVVALGAVVAVLAWLGSLAIRSPAASVPALVAAAWSYSRGRSRDQRWSAQPDAWSEAFGRTLKWALPVGAIGYGVLAGLGIGVPAPDASLQGRTFGGLVFGALAGVMATWVVCCVAFLISIPRLLRRRAA